MHRAGKCTGTCAGNFYGKSRWSKTFFINKNKILRVASILSETNDFLKIYRQLLLATLMHHLRVLFSKIIPAFSQLLRQRKIRVQHERWTRRSCNGILLPGNNRSTGLKRSVTEAPLSSGTSFQLEHCEGTFRLGRTFRFKTSRRSSGAL